MIIGLPQKEKINSVIRLGPSIYKVKLRIGKTHFLKCIYNPYKELDKRLNER